MANTQFDYVKTKDQLGRPEDKGFFVKKRKETIQVQESPTKITQRNMSGGSIYGNSNYGIYGTSTYGAASTGSFVLGSTSFGVLGVSSLGMSGTTETVISVTHTNNTVYEKFTTTIFQNGTASTGLWGSGSAYMSTGSAVQSSEVYKGTNSISQATMITTQTGTPLTLYMSTTGTAGFESVTDSTPHIFGTAGTELIWKAEVPPITGLGFPTPFGTWGALSGGGTARLTDVKIIYE